jgi:predicted DCC family thiol-disulfide oxidoreductase YuxK
LGLLGFRDRTERVEFADAKARVTRRLRQQIGVNCQSMPTSHAAARQGVVKVLSVYRQTPPTFTHIRA